MPKVLETDPMKSKLEFAFSILVFALAYLICMVVYS